MITCYFGLPGAGKSTLLAKIAAKENKKIAKGKSCYDRVLSNYYIDGCYKVTMNDLEEYDLSRSLILLDEITLDADNRDYKNFSYKLKEFFIKHRHEYIDVIYCTQQYDAVDKKIRNLTHELYYMKKCGNFTIAKCIYRHITIPETGEIVNGYIFPTIFQIITAPIRNIKIIYRPRYYKYFDSYEAKQKPKKEFIPWNPEPRPPAARLGALRRLWQKIRTKIKGLPEGRP